LRSTGDPGLIAAQLYVVLTGAMTKQDNKEYCDLSDYRIRINVATQTFVQMVCSQPVETPFPEIAVLALTLQPNSARLSWLDPRQMEN
jgi:hypothetical protein